MAVNDADQAVGIGVEQVEKLFARQRIGDPGEAGQIAEPQHLALVVDLAALDLAAQHARRGLAPEIRGHQGARRVDALGRLQRERKRRQRRFDEGDVALVESVRPARRPRCRDAARLSEAGALAEPHDPREIVRSALGGEAREQRELVGPFAHREPAAHAQFIVFEQPEPRALPPVGLLFRRARGAEIDLLVDAVAGHPIVSLCADQRMQPVGADGGAPERHAGLDEPLAIARDKPGRVISAQPGLDAPRTDFRSIRHGSSASRRPPPSCIHGNLGAAGRRRKLMRRLPCVETRAVCAG